MTSAHALVSFHDPVIRAEWFAAAGLWISGLMLAGLALHWDHRGAIPSDPLAPSDGTAQTTQAPTTLVGQTCSATPGGVFLPEDSIVAHRAP